MNETLKQLSSLNPLTIHKKGRRTKALFALAVVCVAWGITWDVSKKGVEGMPALQMTSIRQIIAGLMYVVFFLIKGAKLPKGKEWTPVLILCFLNFIMSNALSTWGVKFISAGLGSIMAATFPLWIVIINFIISKTKVPALAIIGILLGFGGVCIIFYEHLKDFSNAGFRFGILISLTATFTWACAALYTKREAQHFNPYFSLGLQMLISGITLFATTGLLGIRHTAGGEEIKFAIPLAQIPWQSWAAIAFLIIFGSLIAFICYLYALQNLPIGQVSVYTYVNPVVAVLVGALWFGEKLSLYITIGGLVTLLGVYLVNRAFKTSTVEQPETEGV